MYARTFHRYFGAVESLMHLDKYRLAVCSPSPTFLNATGGMGVAQHGRVVLLEVLLAAAVTAVHVQPGQRIEPRPERLQGHWYRLGQQVQRSAPLQGALR